MSDSTVIDRVRELVAPIALDLGLDVYDVERRGGTLRVTLDTPVGSDAGITLDALALATRLVSRELDHVDPVPGRYTLEVTSPGIERSLRVPEHFRREVGKTVAVRLHAASGDERRVEGDLVAADDAGITVRVGDGERAIPYEQIDRARTVFVWEVKPKPGGRSRSKGATEKSGSKSRERKEKEPS
jgi:ribosome maturation factor RimP